MDILLPLLTLVIGVLLGALAAVMLRRPDESVSRALTSRGEDQAVIRDGLDRLAERMADLEHQRVSWQSQLHQQVNEVRHSTDSLRRETGALTTALRRPQVRGQWGELHLRRTVEAAGMVAHCDFSEQVTMRTGQSTLRPDLVVNLAGGRSIVVDSKTPLDAYLDALTADDDDQEQHLTRHARQVRAHVDSLSSKAYWHALPDNPEFVVLFVPIESCLSAALEADPTLIEYAAARKVVLASPTTLIALLRTIAHGWTTEALVESTREIHQLGRELHDRLGRMGDHFAKLGRSLGSAVESYNATIGSLEARVLVTARQFEDIGVTDARLPMAAPIESAPRSLSAAELLDDARSGVFPPRRGDDEAPEGRSTLGA